MSGHSRWTQIKHKKGATDAKKSQIFAKLANTISLAAREGGDPKTNYKLQTIIERAKACAMPSENIERAIKRGTGKIAGIIVEEALYEGISPDGVIFIIKAITDNKNRTLADIRKILGEYGARLVESGSLIWQFEEKGIIIIPKSVWNDDFALRVIDWGANDFRVREEFVEIYTPKDQYVGLLKTLRDNNTAIEDSSLGWVAKNELRLADNKKESANKILEALDNQNETEEVFTNIANL